MKLTWSLMTVALCSVWAGALVRTDGEPKFNSLPYPTASSIHYPGNRSPSAVQANDNLFASNNAVTNRPAPGLRSDNPLSGFACRRAQPAYVPPGVYRSAPYIMLMLVPGPNHDAKGVHQPEVNGLAKMPAVLPGLRLEPYPSDKK